MNILDVTIGSSVSAQLTDLVGLYLLLQVHGNFPLLIGSLYRDDVLFAIQDHSGTRSNRLEKSLRNFFKDFFSLDIVFYMNHRAVNFLDVTLNLDTGLDCPFLKPGKFIQYINAHSNHPWSTIKGVVMTISVRLLNLSPNREIFQ